MDLVHGKRELKRRTSVLCRGHLPSWQVTPNQRRSDLERIDIQILPVAVLTVKEWDEIWKLTQTYVETNRTFYEAKLRAFPEVALVRTRSGVLVGIAAIDVYRADFRSETSTFILSSSVVIDQLYRRNNIINCISTRFVLHHSV